MTDKEEKRSGALVLASVASMIDQFNIPNIKLLLSLGYSVDVAANFTEPGNITGERAESLKDRLREMGVKAYDVPVPRSLSPSAIRSAYRQVKQLIDDNGYELIHCHSPIGGAIARYAAADARKRGTKVIYTAHGFHFYKGAPIKNWMEYYPAEKTLSRYTDVLITINKEDYQLAKARFKAGRTVYIPGIGVDASRAVPDPAAGKRIREELGIGEDRFLLLSVGELNTNKNHGTVIRALAGMDLTYVIVGKGDLRDELLRTAGECGVDIRLPGYRTDVFDFYRAADAFIIPSFREGLNVSLMEAMAFGLPCACGRIRGNVDLTDEGEGGFFFEPGDTKSIRDAVVSIMNAPDRKRLGDHNIRKIRGSFDSSIINEKMLELYKSL